MANDDVLRLAEGLAPENIILEHGYFWDPFDGVHKIFTDDLMVRIAGTDDVAIIKEYYNRREYENFTVEFADGTIWDETNFQYAPYIGTDLDDIKDGGRPNEFSSGDWSLQGGYGNDILYGRKGNDDLYGKGGDDIYLYGRGMARILFSRAVDRTSIVLILSVSIHLLLPMMFHYEWRAGILSLR